MDKENIPGEYSEESKREKLLRVERELGVDITDPEVVETLAHLCEELSREVYDIRYEIQEIERQRTTPVITSLSEEEQEAPKDFYLETIERLKKGGVEKVLQDWRARSRR